MKSFKPFIAAACAALCILPLTACSKSTLLGKPADKIPVTYEQNNSDSLNAFRAKADEFASVFAAGAYESRRDETNFAVSPISVYMALSTASECSGGATREEILSALGVTSAELKENFPLLFNSLTVEKRLGNKVTDTLIPYNSIWIDKNVPVNTPCIEALSDYYYAYSHSADFKNDNRAANSAVRKFVKEQTRGLIDKDFALSEKTYFALISSLYLKTVWNDDGDDLSYWGSRDFTCYDGAVKNTRLLSGYYCPGRAYTTENYSSFFVQTNGGYKIKFVVPGEGYSVRDIFTDENIFAVNALRDYNTDDHENRVSYSTRCIFPEYKCGYDNEISGILRDKFGIEGFFNDPGLYPTEQACDFSGLTTEACFCRAVRHVTDLTVDKTGIEGAAVTVMEMDGATSAGPGEYERVYEDFFVDKAFGFIITDRYDVALFSGVINSL